jgi:hypothetical protein
MVLASVDEAWSLGGSIMTFLLPMLAFVAIALALLVLYTKPQLIPGHRTPGAEESVGATRQPGVPVSGGQAPEGNGEAAPGSPGAGKSGEPVSAE